MKYEIEVISPVHIGSGGTISPIEYVVEDKFYRVDMDGLFEDDRFDTDGFIEDAKAGAFYLGRFDSKLAKEHVRYGLDVSNSVKNDLCKSVYLPSGEIREFIKTKDLPYIPGSSIKGAIRTAMLWKALNDPRILQDAKEIIRTHGRVNPKKAGEGIEKIVFGRNPNYDILRALQVSDSKITTMNNLELSKVVMLSDTRDGYGWKTFRGKRSFINHDYDDATPIFIEALKPGSTLTGTLKIDNWLLRGEGERIAEELQFDGKQYLIEDVAMNCKAYAKDFITGEITFFERYSGGALRRVIEFYKTLREELNESSESEFLLHTSWGSGWHGMTVGNLFDVGILREKFDLGKNIKRSFCKRCNTELKKERPDDRFYDYCPNCRRHIRRYDQYQKIVKMIWPFPKTRRLVFENDNPRYPLGWLKLRIGD
jgi:CRISPR-associated protein Csm5